MCNKGEDDFFINEGINSLLKKEFKKILKYKYTTEINYNYDAVKELAYNKKLTKVDKKVYNLIFYNQYPYDTLFLDIIEFPDTEDLSIFFLKMVPREFLMEEDKEKTGNCTNTFSLIKFVFQYYQNLIPKLLKIMSKSNRDDLIVYQEYVKNGILDKVKNTEEINDCFYMKEENLATYCCSNTLEDYNLAKNYIETHCIKNFYEDYLLVPFCINDKTKEKIQIFHNVLFKVNSDLHSNKLDINQAKISIESIVDDIIKYIDNIISYEKKYTQKRINEGFSLIIQNIFEKLKIDNSNSELEKFARTISDIHANFNYSIYIECEEVQLSKINYTRTV